MNEFDSRAAARRSLDMLECADRLRWIATSPGWDGAGLDGKAAEHELLLAAARLLERRIPIHGLTSLGIVNYGIHPADQAWLLREHLQGRNPGGAAGPGEDLRRSPWIRHRERDDSDQVIEDWLEYRRDRAPDML